MDATVKEYADSWLRHFSSAGSELLPVRLPSFPRQSHAPLLPQPHASITGKLPEHGFKRDLDIPSAPAEHRAYAAQLSLGIWAAPNEALRDEIGKLSRRTRWSSVLLLEAERKGCREERLTV